MAGSLGLSGCLWLPATFRAPVNLSKRLQVPPIEAGKWDRMRRKDKIYEHQSNRRAMDRAPSAVLVSLGLGLLYVGIHHRYVQYLNRLSVYLGHPSG